jgi:hypothetical protein
MYTSSPLGISTLLQGVLAYPKITALICCATLIAGLYSNGKFSSTTAVAGPQACVAMKDDVPMEFHFYAGEEYTQEIADLAQLPCEPEPVAQSLPPISERACTPIPPGYGKVKKVNPSHKKRTSKNIVRKVRKHKGGTPKSVKSIVAPTGCLEDLR